jgi:MEMO1 family protein
MLFKDESALKGERTPQYAGTWYESNPQRLDPQLTEFLRLAEDELGGDPKLALPENAQVMAIISPHAGYLFSGKTAAFGYERVRNQGIQRVILLGPSHHVGFTGVALPSAASYSTPLGSLPVDTELVNELKEYALYSFQPQVHKVEHSLELQLPFIMKALGPVKIVPLVVGVLHDETEIRLIAETLKGFIRKGDLVVVSSDFTHFGPRYQYRPFLNDIKQNVRRLDEEALKYLCDLDVEGFLEFQVRTQATICGFFPCAILAAMLPSQAKCQLLKYATSQETLVEDQDNSVSYLSILYSGPGWPTESQSQLSSDSIKLSDGEKRDLLSLANRTIEKYASEGRPIAMGETGITPTTTMDECFGCFVTLYKRYGRGADDKELRGCIGSIWPVRPLYKAVMENAIAASSRDPRFHPVQTQELSTLHIEISVLTPPRRVASHTDIVLGRDGIILTKNRRQSVFLPHVATEFGWDLPETLRQLCVKAGLRDDDWKQGCKYDVFQTVIFGQDDLG